MARVGIPCGRCGYILRAGSSLGENNVDTRLVLGKFSSADGYGLRVLYRVLSVSPWTQINSL